MRRAWRAAGCALLVLALSHPAAAHSLDHRFGDFYGGVLHPLSALTHVLPIFAVGQLAGQQGERAARWLVLAFPLALVIGAGLAAALPTLPSMAAFNAAWFVVLGLLVAAAWRLPLPVPVALGALVGITHLVLRVKAL